ncbi:MAG: flagellar basal body L-ring protein FlgH [Thermodesulfovibrionales bacterium]|nr:flagellar basal body L-ring protein FlgH [Thermodesulfovibrionales bacterium]
MRDRVIRQFGHDRGYRSEYSGFKIKKTIKNSLLLYCFTALIICSCATPSLPPPPPKYVNKEESAIEKTRNSLWTDGGALFEDLKARRLNDIVTIKVMENIAGSGKADTSTKRDSSLEAGVDEFFGAPLNLNLRNFYGQGYTFSPSVKGGMKDDFKGSGETNRQGRLIGTITAKVVEVMPNGNLILEARKEIVINNEKQIFILKGMARPDDIAVDNTILSTRLTDTEIYFVGKGVLQDKQKPGWLVRILDKIWPF